MRLNIISEFQHGQKPQKWFTDFEANPDSWFTEDGAVPFIYNPDGLLDVGDYGDTHAKIIASNIIYYVETYAPQLAGSPDLTYTIRRYILEKVAALGRISPTNSNGTRYVAFWNNKLIVECLKSLIQNDLLSMRDIIVSGNRHMCVIDYLRGGRFEHDAEEENRKQKMRELHLMRPDAKKAAMKDLGLDAASRKQPWQKSAEQNKLVRPGQKWWAMQSESLW